jgi:putative flavoprotein involved in K+ transport
MAGSVFDTLVIGGGQTGLTVGHELAGAGRSFVILDAAERVGEAWRKRWDSLVLFTPAGFSGLPGMDFPAPRDHFPGKDEVAHYLESYARAMELPVISGTRVRRLSKDGDMFMAETGNDTFSARNVVVAMADHQKPSIPRFADELDPRVNQLHSSDYQNLRSLQEGATLVVGLGNSGADLGLEIVSDRQTYVSGSATGAIPFRIDGWFGRRIGVHIVRFLATRVLTTSTPVGRRVRAKMLTKAQPLVRVRPHDLVSAGAEIVPRVTGVSRGMPELADGRRLEVANVVWCTGFERRFDWIDLPVFTDEGRPRHERGVVEDMPGLFFCGLFFQHSLWSETLVGMPEDVRYVIEQLRTRALEGRHPAQRKS